MLKEDIAHYDRQENIAGSKDFTYEYLLDAIDRQLKHDVQDGHTTNWEKIFDVQIKNMKSGKTLTPAAMLQAMAAPSGGAGNGGKQPKGGGGKGAKGAKGGGGQGQGGRKGSPKGGGRPTSPGPTTTYCWYHNAAHYWPDSGIKCSAPLDPVTQKSTCKFEHNLYKKEVFESLKAPKGKGKGAKRPGGVITFL